MATAIVPKADVPPCDASTGDTESADANAALHFFVRGTTHRLPVRSEEQRTQPPLDRNFIGGVARRVAISYALIVLFGIALGRTVVGPLKTSAGIRWDERIVGTISDNRTPVMNSFTKVFSKLADAPSIVAVGAVVSVVLLAQRRIRVAVLVPVILAFELMTFLSITYPVHRVRPEVVHLGSVPGTGSFPSGHIAATLVLYGTLVMILRYARAGRHVVLVAAVWTAAATMAVGWSRVYRGMHHPIDVLAGAALGAAVLIGFHPIVRVLVYGQNRAARRERNPGV